MIQQQKLEDARNPKMLRHENPKMQATQRCEKPKDARNSKIQQTQKCEKPRDARNPKM